MCKKKKPKAVFVVQADNLGFLSSVVTYAARVLMYYVKRVPNCTLLSYILNILSALVSKLLSRKCSALFAHSKRFKKMSAQRWTLHILNKQNIGDVVA